MAQRIERIRRSARPIATPATDRRRTPAQRLDPRQIAARLNAGVQPTDDATDGTGSGGGRGTNPHGRGSGSSDGAVNVGGSGRGNGSGNGSGDGDGDGDGGGGGGQDPFLAAISAALRDAWDTPSRGEIGSGDRAVAVKITLRSDGRVTAFQVTRSSGNAALDQSVELMLRQLRVLPAPAQYGYSEPVRTIDIVFRAV
jgi:TonB family protein